MKRLFAAGIESMARRPALVILVWTLFYNLEKFALGPYSFVVIGDEADSRLAFMVAWWRWFFEPFQHFWTPHALAGFDSTAASADPGIEALFFALLPGWMAYGIFRLACVYLEGYFVFRLLHDALSVRTGIALGSGFVYVAINHHYFPDEQLFGLLPLILWAVTRDWGTPRRGVAVLMALAIFYTYGSVYAFTLFTLPAVWLWALAFHTRDRARWLGVIAFTATYFILNLPRLVAGLLLGAESARSYSRSWWFDTLNQSLMLPQGYWMLAILLMALAACFLWRDARLARVLVVNLTLAAAGPALSGAAAIMGWLVGGRLWEQIGMRFYETAPLVNVLVLGVLAEVLLVRVRAFAAARAASWTVTAAIMLAALAAAVETKRANIWDMLHSSVYAFAFEHPELKSLAAHTRSIGEPFRVAGFNAFRTNWRLEEGFLWAYGFETAGGFINVWPMRYREYWERVLAPLRAQDATIDIKMNNKAYLFMNETGFVWQMCGTAPIRSCVLRPTDFYNMNLLAFLNVLYIISPIPFDHPSLVLRPSSIRDYLLDTELEKVRQRWQRVLKGEPALNIPLYVYENRDALPRFFVAPQIYVSPTPSDVLDAMSAADLSTLRTTVFLDEETARQARLRTGGAGGTVKIVGLRADDISLEVNDSGGGALVSSTSYNRFWKACVGGQPVTPIRVNHAFLGLALEPGSYKVTLSYAPPWRPWADPCRA